MSVNYEYFISHSSKDVEIVKEFCTFLQTAADVQKKDIFCTSLPDNGLPNDEYFFPKIKEFLFSSKNIIFLISWNFLASHDCVMELGMSHMLCKEQHQRICLFIGEPTFDNIPKMLAGIQQLGNLQEPLTLTKMKKLLYPDVTEAVMPASQWEDRKNSFLQHIHPLIDRITKQRLYTESEYSEIKRALEIKQQELEHNQATCNDITQKLNTAMEKNKSLQKQLKEARANISEELVIDELQTDKEKFEELKSSAKIALNKLPGIVQDVIYHEAYSRTGTFSLNGYWTQEDFMNAVNSGYLCEDSPCLNEDNRKVSQVLSALEELQNFLSDESCSIIERLEEEADANACLSNKDFWNYLFN